MHTNHNEYQNSQSRYVNDEVSLLPFILMLFRYRRLILMFMLAGAVLAGVYTIFMYKKVYSANSFILLRPPSKVINMDQDPIIGDILKDTYKVVLRTNHLCEKVILSKYDYTTDGKKESINLLKYYDTNSMKTVVKIIRDNLNLTLDKNSLLLTLSYIDKDPEMAAQIVNNIVREFDNYYNTLFFAVINRNLEFVTKGIENAKKELDEARSNLRTFVATNKQLKIGANQKSKYSAWYSSQQTLQQLEEKADAKTKTYNNMMINYEKLKFQVSENASTITILEKAIPPQDPVPRKGLKASLIGAFFGAFAASVYVFLINLTTLFSLKTNPLETVFVELKKDLKKLNIFKI